jgi:hypothetical protein
MVSHHTILDIRHPIINVWSTATRNLTPTHTHTHKHNTKFTDLGRGQRSVQDMSSLTRVFVGKLAPDVTESMLREELERYLCAHQLLCFTDVFPVCKS